MPRIAQRILRCLTLAVAGAALLGQPIKAHADGAHHRHAYHRYVHRAAAADRYRSVEAIIAEVQSSPFYGPFGGYYDAAAASRYYGPYARHYFGFGPPWQ